MSNAPKKSIPRPGRKPVSEPAPVAATAPSATQAASGSQQIALLAAQAGLEKKATGVEIIDVTGKVDYADYLVLMTGASDRNVAAIAQEVDGALSKAGFRSMSVEGLPAAQWVLIDFVDVVVHVFQKDVRSLYDLDGLWMDADRVPMQAGVGGEPADDEIQSVDRVLPARARTKASKRPTKKAKAAGAKPNGRRAAGTAGSRTSAAGRSSAGARGSAGTGSSAGTRGSSRGAAASRGTSSRGAAGGGASARATASTGGSARGPARASAAAKPARKAKTRKAK